MGGRRNRSGEGEKKRRGGKRNRSGGRKMSGGKKGEWGKRKRSAGREEKGVGGPWGPFGLSYTAIKNSLSRLQPTPYEC